MCVCVCVYTHTLRPFTPSVVKVWMPQARLTSHTSQWTPHSSTCGPPASGSSFAHLTTSHFSQPLHPYTAPTVLADSLSFHLPFCVVKLCPTLCKPVAFSTPGFPVFHYVGRKDLCYSWALMRSRLQSAGWGKTACLCSVMSDSLWPHAL